MDFDIHSIEQLREGNQLEAKAAQGGLPDSVWDSYSAFANTDGGIILLGVKERADHSLLPVGVADAPKMVRDFWNMVNNRQKVSVNLMTDRRVRIETIDGKDIILLDVPRADRSSRPVHKGLDPRTGTYRRNGEGDYLCSLEEVSAMFRDAALSPQDAKVMQEMDYSVFCQDSISGYRQVFRSTHPNHTWNRLEDEVFLRRIGAMAAGDDGLFHPTAAGLLMFGYEHEITQEFPLYFLDYQEGRRMAATRWTDRIVSTSGDWSGNIFDFVYKVVPRLTADLSTPFVMRGMQRIDDTPVHKVLREAVTNTCVHADFYGRRGVVITNNNRCYTFANPGSMRVSKAEALMGGVSDPRNGVLLKMFSLINYGERAGSGLNSIFQVWNHVYHTEATISEEMGVDRVVLTLDSTGHTPDIHAMLELYDDPEELTLIENPDNESAVKEEEKSAVKSAVKNKESAVKKDEYKVEGNEDAVKEDDRASKNKKNTVKSRVKSRVKSKVKSRVKSRVKDEEKSWVENEVKSRVKTSDIILDLIEDNPYITRIEMADRMLISVQAIDKQLKNLREKGIIRRVGPDKGGHWEVIANQAD